MILSMKSTPFRLLFFHELLEIQCELVRIVVYNHIRQCFVWETACYFPEFLWIDHVFFEEDGFFLFVPVNELFPLSFCGSWVFDEVVSIDEFDTVSLNGIQDHRRYFGQSLEITQIRVLIALVSELFHHFGEFFFAPDCVGQKTGSSFDAR